MPHRPVDPHDLDAFVAWMADRGYAFTTQRAYRRIVARWQASRQTARAWLESMQEASRRLTPGGTRAPTATAPQYRKALLVWHEWARVPLPDGGLQLPRVLRRVYPNAPRALSHAEEAAVAGGLAGDLLDEPYRSLLRVIQATGMRCSEAAGLRLQDVKAGPDGWATIDVVAGKGGRSRAANMPPDAARALVAYLRGWRASRPGPWLFPSPKMARQAVTTRAVQLACARLGAAVAVPDLHPHLFRHTLATRLMEAGVPPKIAAGVMGHQNPRTTQAVYQHSSPEAEREALARLLPTGGPPRR
jgi:integrase